MDDFASDSDELHGQSSAERHGALSLKQLSQAFAAKAGVSQRGADDDRDPLHPSADSTPRAIVEAILFVGRPDNSAIAASDIAQTLRDLTPADVDQLIHELDDDYASENRPYRIASEGGGYRMVLADAYRAVRDRYLGRLKGARLSPAAIEVLALVAYNEPATSDEVNRLRGAPSGQILSHLVRRNLLRVQQPQSKGEKKRYFTTPRFLEVFALTSLADLPRAEELEKQ
jgi:segregation and condensation protein B